MRLQSNYMNVFLFKTVPSENIICLYIYLVHYLCLKHFEVFVFSLFICTLLPKQTFTQVTHVVPFFGWMICTPVFLLHSFYSIICSCILSSSSFYDELTFNCKSCLYLCR